MKKYLIPFFIIFFALHAELVKAVNTDLEADASLGGSSVVIRKRSFMGDPSGLSPEKKIQNAGNHKDFITKRCKDIEGAEDKENVSSNRMPSSRFEGTSQQSSTGTFLSDPGLSLDPEVDAMVQEESKKALEMEEAILTEYMTFAKDIKSLPIRNPEIPFVTPEKRTKLLDLFSNVVSLGAEGVFDIESNRPRVVYQNPHLINLQQEDAKGGTNFERMLHGKSPVGPDKKNVELHHITQHEEEALLEISHSLHSRWHGALHPKPRFKGGLSTEERRVFNKFRAFYWKLRGLQMFCIDILPDTSKYSLMFLKQCYSGLSCMHQETHQRLFAAGFDVSYYLEILREHLKKSS